MIAIHLPTPASVPIPTSSPFSYLIVSLAISYYAPILDCSQHKPSTQDTQSSTTRSILHRHQPSNPASLPLRSQYRSNFSVFTLPYTIYANGEIRQQRRFDGRRSAQDVSKDVSALINRPARDPAIQPAIHSGVDDSGWVAEEEF